MDKNEYTILRNLYEATKHRLTQEEFIKSFLGVDIANNPDGKYNILDADYFTKTVFTTVADKLNDKSQWFETVQDITALNKEVILNKMLEIFSLPIEKSISYYTNNRKSKKKEEKYYEKDACKKIGEKLLELKKEPYSDYEFFQVIWYIVYLAVYKHLPEDNKIQNDYEEFNFNVIKKYGAVTKPAQRAIVELAKKGNVVAQNTLGELFLYGRIAGDEPHYEKAYSYFLKAAGDISNDGSVHLPIACWNVAYMLFNYQFRRELKNVHISELNNTTLRDRIENAINYCILALKIDKKCMPAFNLLGVILNVLEETTDSIISSTDRDCLKNKIILNEDLKRLLPEGKECIAETLFEIASSAGYVESLNNLWRIYCRKAFDELQGSSDEQKYISEAIKYLEKSAKNHCTWANNKLGELYREGYINIYYETIGKSESRPYENLIDMQKAKEYYLSAIDYFIDKDSAWAAYHLLESYLDELDRDTKNRCRDIIEMAKNKEVIEKYKLLKMI